jgi:signal transduction histidine kinase
VHVDTDAETLRLRAVLRDLVALSAIPAVWTGREPLGVATGLADELVELLQLDFAFVRLCDPDGAGAVEVTRGDAWKRFPEWLERHLGTTVQFPRKEIVPDVGGGSERCHGIATRLGVSGEGGVVAAASKRSDFPTATDQLLVSLAANQAATAFQSSRLVEERRRAEEALREARNELEMKVAERTAELRRSQAYLARLAEEQAALRRVATLVADGASPTVVFDAVAAEMERLLDADRVALNRYEAGDEFTVVAHRGLGASVAPPGSRLRHERETVTSLVRRTERPARVEQFAQADGASAELARVFGVNAAVGAPIVVDGRVWGVFQASWSREESPPADTEERMANFAELLETAIANADSRDQLDASRARLVTEADEARRRVVRDLHDGAQQRLVHTILMLKLAQRALRQNDGQAESLVGEALQHAEQGNAELRELAHGILPAVLTQGLRAAVGSVVNRLDLPVEVDVPAERFPAEIEASAYFIVAEALTNVVKHAHAGRADVRASVEAGMLHVEVRDDGIGGADPGGHGLVGMGDRVTALGGRLEIESPADGGTLVAAAIPLRGSSAVRSSARAS